MALIFNYAKYKGRRQPERNGTDTDCKSIKISFEGLGFRVQQYDDLPVGNLK